MYHYSNTRSLNQAQHDDQHEENEMFNSSRHKEIDSTLTIITHSENDSIEVNISRIGGTVKTRITVVSVDGRHGNIKVKFLVSQDWMS